MAMGELSGKVAIVTGASKGIGPLEALTEDEFHRQFDINVLGTLLATREAVSAFNGEGGSVINLSTISSVNPVPNSVIYSASKSAIDSITKALAKELSDRKSGSTPSRRA
jgi:3-oxoacyl-[acyl-carrier protein] reductase